MIPRCTKPPKFFSTRSNRKPRDEEKDRRFISLVCQWYWNFGVKKEVTMSELKFVGAQIATRLQIEVPPNWLSAVRKKHGVQIQPCGKTKPKKLKTDLQQNRKTMANNCGNAGQTIYEDVTPTEKCDSTRFAFPNFSIGQSSLQQPLINPLTQPLFDQLKSSVSTGTTHYHHNTAKETPYLHKTHIF